MSPFSFLKYWEWDHYLSKNWSLFPGHESDQHSDSVSWYAGPNSCNALTFSLVQRPIFTLQQDIKTSPYKLISTWHFLLQYLTNLQPPHFCSALEYRVK